MVPARLEAEGVENLLSKDVDIAEARLASMASMIGKTLYQSDFRRRFGVNVLALRSDGKVSRHSFQDQVLMPNMLLLVHGKKDRLEAIRQEADFDQVDLVTRSAPTDLYGLQEGLFS